MRKPTALTAILLLLANLIPAYGVLYAGWDLFRLLFLYWFETVVIAVFNLFKTAKASGSVGQAAKVYGGFLFVEFSVIYGLFAGSGTRTPNAIFNGTSAAALGMIFASHAVSYVMNFLGKKEYQMPRTIAEPFFRRILLMHLVAGVGGYFILRFGSPFPALLILVALKTAFDLLAHLEEHGSVTINVRFR